MAIISGIVAIYYNIVMAWTTFYLLKSMALKVPWQSCTNWWNTDSCGYTNFNGSLINGTWYNETMVEKLNITRQTLNTPAEEFWK